MHDTDIGWAIYQLRAGKKVCRAGWNGHGMWLELQRADANSKMKQPYIFINPANGDLVPWTASQVDLLGLDWQIVD